jgi:hypothetical protein
LAGLPVTRDIITSPSIKGMTDNAVNKFLVRSDFDDTLIMATNIPIGIKLQKANL